MRIYWWQNGLHISPETKEDFARLRALMAIFETAKIVKPDAKNTLLRGGKQQQSEGVEEIP